MGGIGIETGIGGSDFARKTGTQYAAKAIGLISAEVHRTRMASSGADGCARLFAEVVTSGSTADDGDSILKVLEQAAAKTSNSQQQGRSGASWPRRPPVSAGNGVQTVASF